MSLDDLLLRRRAAAERRMRDICIIERPGELVTDPETGVVTPGYTPVYSGPCKIQQTIAQSATPQAGEHQFTVQDSALHIPVGAGPVAVDDVATITAAAMNPALLGNVYRVSETFEKSQPTAQRLRIEEVTA